jgi:hypothetical protein
MPPCFLMYLSKYVSLGCYHSFSKTTRCGNEHERYNTREASPNDGGFFPISLNDKIMFLAYNLKYYEKKYKTHWYLKKTIKMSSNL